MKLKVIIVSLLISVGAIAQQEITLEKCRQMALENSNDLQIAEKTKEKALADKRAIATMYLPNFKLTGLGAYIHDDIEQTISKEIKEDAYLPTYVFDGTQLQPNVVIDGSGNMIIGADGNPIFKEYAYLPLDMNLDITLSLSFQGAYMAGLAVEQPIFQGGKITSGYRMAKIGTEMADYNVDMQRMATIYEVDQAYWLYISVLEKVTLARQALNLLDTLKNTLKNSFEVGMVNENEYLKIQVAHNKARLDVQQAENGLELARMSLCRAIGVDYSTQLVTTDTTIEIGNIFSIQNASSVDNRPEYALLQKQVELEQRNVDLVRADYLPTAGVSAGYYYIGGIDICDEEYKNNTASILATVNIPLFHWSEGYQKVKSAKIAADIKQLEFEKNTRLLELEMEQAKRQLEDAYKNVDLTTESLAQADENLRISKNSYDLGMGSITDYLVAQTEWQQAHSKVIEAKANCKTKETTYLKTCGLLGK